MVENEPSETTIFAVFAYHNWQNGKQSFAVVFIALALLFQPFVKIALGMAMWNIADVIVALGLIALWWLTQKRC